MAKKGKSSIDAAIRRAYGNVGNTRRNLKDAREGAYDVASGNVQGIYGNLAGYTRGAKKYLSTENARALARLADLERRGKTQIRATNKRAAADPFAIGGLMQANTTGVNNRLVRTQQRAGMTKLRGEEKVGRQIAKGGRQLVDLAQANAAEQKQAANQSLAEALGYRAREDATLVAQMKHDIAMAELNAQIAEEQMRLQEKLAFNSWKKQQAYTEKLTHDPATARQVNTLSEDVTSAAAYIQRYKQENPDATRSDVLSWAMEQDWADAENGSKVYGKLIENLSQNDALGTGGTWDQARDAVFDTVRYWYPDWHKRWNEHIHELIQTQLNATWNSILSPQAQASAANPVNPKSAGDYAGPGVSRASTYSNTGGEGIAPAGGPSASSARAAARPPLT